jgi:hypothetical protein
VKVTWLLFVNIGCVRVAVCCIYSRALKNSCIVLILIFRKMMANFLFFVLFGMMLLERTSRYFFVSCLTEDQANLGSVVFVSAVSILWCARDVWFNIIFNGFDETNQTHSLPSGKSVSSIALWYTWQLTLHRYCAVTSYINYVTVVCLIALIG